MCSPASLYQVPGMQADDRWAVFRDLSSKEKQLLRQAGVESFSRELF